MTQQKDPDALRRPPAGDPERDKRFVLWSLAVLAAIFVFFNAIGRIDFHALTASDTSQPQTETTGQARSGGSATLPKGPAEQR